MSWILLEGLDRSGKSSVAKYYKDQGYEVIHMSAPDKKYFKEKYSGESYLEEIVRMYSKYDGKDVVFDRTVYGELVWPNIFGRLSLLNEEDLEYLSMMERNNDCDKILMYDSNTDAHWQRCLDNNEPLSRLQFGRANVFYERLAREYSFIKKELPDFPEIGVPRSTRSDGAGTDSVSRDVGSASKHVGNNDIVGPSDQDPKVGNGISNKVGNVGQSLSISEDSITTIEQKLERANAIRSLLQGKIVKKQGKIYDDIDENIRRFLQRELDSIFTKRLDSEIFTENEVNILKSLVQRVQEKAK